MNKSRLIATFVLALLIAAAASLFVMNKLKQSARASASTNSHIVMAARNLDIGAKLSEADLRVGEWAAGPAPQGSFTKVSDAVGRAVLYPTFQDEAILEAKLAPVGSGAGLPAVIPEGMRAVSIRVDDVVAVAGFVGPGTRVDVLLTGTPGVGRGGNEPLTKTILENVQVLAAGEKIQPDATGKAERVNVVTLLCSPEDSAKLTLAANEGRIQLVLRNPSDNAKDKENMAAVGRGALYGGTVLKAEAPASGPVRVARRRQVPVPPPLATPPPPPPKPEMAVIEMIRAERVSKVEMPLGPNATGTGSGTTR
ncbi:MAG TPA: Flp pilus assembly protein CpaB [Bryobacterales bacterium]|nr:Flp pilus assembly protein CpaB [Bryobacterales bacterium]